MIRLLLADVMPLYDPAVYAELYGKASSARRASADSFRFKKDRILSLGATALLDFGLGASGLRERDMSYGRTAYGKPFFLNAPDIHFNISHSSTKVAVCLSDREAGCDIEEVTDIDLTVAERFFSSEEYLAVKAGTKPEERNETFFRYWTLKESYMKATGLGLTLMPDSFTIHFADGTVSVTGKHPDTGFSFITPDPFPGYRCALCFRPECGVPDVERVSLL